LSILVVTDFESGFNTKKDNLLFWVLNGLVLYKTTSQQKNPKICGISIKRDTLHIPV